MLQLKNINKSFFDTKNKSRKIKILEEINLEVKSKKILFLKVVNGSGKTTLQNYWQFTSPRFWGTDIRK